jgi:hypothetical protein
MGGKIREEIKDKNLREKLEEDQKNRKKKNKQMIPRFFSYTHTTLKKKKNPSPRETKQ